MTMKKNKSLPAARGLGLLEMEEAVVMGTKSIPRGGSTERTVGQETLPRSQTATQLGKKWINDRKLVKNKSRHPEGNGRRQQTYKMVLKSPNESEP